MANKFLTLVNGIKTLVMASSTGGAGNEDNLVTTDGSGLIDPSLLPPGSAPLTQTVVVNEATGLTAGDFVNVYYDGTATAVRVRKADANDIDRFANGFVLAAFADTTTATVYIQGKNSAMTPLASTNDGERAFLSETAGLASVTSVPVTDGNISQVLGPIDTDGRVIFEYNEPIEIDIA